MTANISTASLMHTIYLNQFQLRIELAFPALRYKVHKDVCVCAKTKRKSKRLDDSRHASTRTPRKDGKRSTSSSNALAEKFVNAAVKQHVQRCYFPARVLAVRHCCSTTPPNYYS